MISRVSFVVLCSVIVTRAHLVPYTLGGTTIMVDSEVLKYSSPLLAHIENGMPHRRDSNEEQASEIDSDLRNNKYEVSNSESSFIQEDQGGQSSDDHKYKQQNDFKKDSEGHLDISVLDEGQSVYPYRGQTLYPSTFTRPKPITWENAAGIYLGQDKIPLEPVQNSQPSLYYSVENPDESHVSQTIHKIVSSLNENTADVKLNDRAPVPIVPPIPGAQSFVNSVQQQQQNEDPSNTFTEDSDSQIDTNTESIHSELQGDDNVENYPTESQVAINDDSLNEPNAQDSIDPITILGNFQTEAYLDDHISMGQGMDSQDGDQHLQKTEENVSTNPSNSNDEAISIDQPEADAITEASTDDTATEIPLEEILEKKEEELELLALQSEQIIKEEQEHQEALDQAMANMFDSLFTPSQPESDKENESEVESNTDAPVANENSLAEEKDASGTGTDDDMEKNSEVHSAVPQEPPTHDETSVLSTNQEEQEQELSQNEKEVQQQESDQEQNVQEISESTNNDNVAIIPVETQDKEQGEASQDENGHLTPEQQDTSSDAVEKIAEDTQSKPYEESHAQQDITSESEDVDLNPSNNQDNQGKDTQSKPNEESHAQQDITSESEDVGLNPSNNQDNQGKDTQSKPNEESHAQQDITSESEDVDLNPSNNQDNQGTLEITPSEDALPQSTKNDGKNDPIEEASEQTDNQNFGSDNTDDSIYTDFPNTRGDPAETTDETFYYSTWVKNPLPITGDQAAGIYIDNEKVFNKQNPGPPPGYSTRHDSPVDDAGLLTWYDQDPINIFDPVQGNQPEKDTPVDSEKPDHSIRTPQNPSDNEIPNGRPTIPGHVPKLRPATDDPNLDENEGEEEAGVQVNATKRHPGAVFHSAQPDLLSKSTCRCGMRFTPTKIVGGTQTDIEEFPWMVGLATKVDDFIYCGGALLNDLYILTAAHCVHGQYPEDIYIQLGSTKRDSNNFVNINADKFIIHPKYDINVVYKADIALIKLAKPVEDFTDKIFPVCLTQGEESFADMEAIISGWGRNTFGGDVTQGLMEATVTVMSTRKCRQNSYYQKHEVHKKIMCARARGIDACQGDSGGPLVVLDGNQYKHIGIVSWGIGCAQPKYPGIYTRTSSYSKWIMANSKGGVGCRQGKAKKNKNKKNKNKKKRKKNKFPLGTYLRRRNKNKNRKGDSDNGEGHKKNKRKNQNNKTKGQGQSNTKRRQDNPKNPDRQKNKGLVNILSLLGGNQNSDGENYQVSSDDASLNRDKPVTASQDPGLSLGLGQDVEDDESQTMTSNDKKNRDDGSQPSEDGNKRKKQKDRNHDAESQPPKGNKNNRNNKNRNKTRGEDERRPSESDKEKKRNKNKGREDDNERRPQRGHKQKRKNKYKQRTDVDESESPADDEQTHKLQEIELSEPVETHLSVSKKDKKKNKNRKQNGNTDEEDSDILMMDRDTNRETNQNKDNEEEDEEVLSSPQPELDWSDLSQALLGIGDIIASENNQEGDTTT